MAHAGGVTVQGAAEPHASETGAPQRDRAFKWIAASAGACLVAFVVFVVVRGPSHPSTPGSAALRGAPPVLKVGTVAPAFSLPALGSGQPVSLASLRGRPVIVSFFASWCPDCRAELAALASAAQSARGRVGVIGVDANESSQTTAARLLAAAHATYPVGLDANAAVATRYLVQALPVTYFLDAHDRVVGAALGPQTRSSLQHWVHHLEGQR